MCSELADLAEETTIRMMQQESSDCPNKQEDSSVEKLRETGALYSDNAKQLLSLWLPKLPKILDAPEEAVLPHDALLDVYGRLSGRGSVGVCGSRVRTPFSKMMRSLLTPDSRNDAGTVGSTLPPRAVSIEALVSWYTIGRFANTPHNPLHGVSPSRRGLSVALDNASTSPVVLSRSFGHSSPLSSPSSPGRQGGSATAGSELQSISSTQPTEPETSIRLCGVDVRLERSGLISKSGVRTCLASLGYGPEVLDTNVFETLFNDTDANGDGLVTIEELTSLLASFGECDA